MPNKKVLATVDRFRITCEAKSEQMGPIIAQLARMGLSNVHYELMTDVYTKNKRPEVNGTDFLTPWLMDNPKFKAIDAVNYFKENGRSDAAAYGAMTKLCKARVLKKVSAGIYARADVPLPPTTPKGHRGSPVRYDTSNYDLIVQYARKHGNKFNLTQVKELLAANHRPPSSGSPAIRALIHKDLVRRGPRDGEFVLRAKAKPKSHKAKDRHKDSPHGRERFQKLQKRIDENNAFVDKVVTNG